VDSPIREGVIRNWEDMEKIWNHVLMNELKVQSEEHPILLTEAPLNPKHYREKMTQIMFEQFNVPCLYASVQAVLALYSSGRTSGVVLDCGDDVSHAVPIYEGYSVLHAIQRVPLAGAKITDYLKKTLAEKGFQFNDLELIREIKERECYVASDFDYALGSAAETAALEKFYDLPDGRKIPLAAERVKCPEILF